MSITIEYTAFGGPEVLTVVETDVAAPAPGEVTLQNRAISVNPFDWKVVAGIIPIGQTFPATPGNESSGVVTAVGEGVDGIGIGDAVIWSGLGGGYRASANVSATSLIPMPHGLAFGQAAVVGAAGGTAYAIVRQLDLGPGDTVVINGAAGGVGAAAVQIARSVGATVIGVASEANHDYLRSIGAVPVSYGDGLADRLREVGPATAAADTVGGGDFPEIAVSLLGGASRMVTIVPDATSQRLGVPPLRRSGDDEARALELAAAGKLTFELTSIPLEQASRALDLSRGGHVRGKLVLIP